MRKRSDIKGLTLLETAIVLIIGGLMMAMLFSAMEVYFKNRKLVETREKLALIDRQVQQYLIRNGSLPCVAPMTAAQDTATFGLEFNANCNGMPASSGIVTAGGVRIGGVPTRTLNLPDSYSFDGWGNRFVYAVTRVHAVNFVAGAGAVSVVDSGNNSVVDPAGSADYVLLSAGPNGRGAYNMQGSAREPCAAAGAGANDRENCDDDGVFMTTLLNSEGVGVNYDDIVIYQRMIGGRMEVPSDAVIPFNLSTCPTGWNASTGIPSAGGLIYCERR